MSSQKRGRTVEYEEDGYSPHSIDGSNSHKKARTLQPQRRQSKTADTDDGYERDGMSDTYTESGIWTRPAFEANKGEGFEDVEDEDLDTQRATQIIQRRNRLHMENMAAENGVVEAITCINFMCHTKLHVSLGPLINFIIGHNGSGKSAVLTALTLCLGAKATSTNRGQSLKSFIKEGQESATLAVRVKNRGEGSYQKDIYGDSIIVERHFSKSGASGFKLKSASGRIISTKKSDLEEICDHFCLQIDNPMNVLSQDMARQFLNSSSPSEKYKFFVKGVHLEDLDHDYQLLAETIEGVETTLNNKKDDLSALKKDADRARDRLALSDKHDSVRQKIRNLSRQMAWAQVEQQEKALEGFQRKLDEANQAIEEYQARASRKENDLQDAHRKWEDSKDEVKLAKDSLLPLQEERKQKKAEFEKNKADLLSVQTDQRSIRDHLKTAEATITKAQAEISAEYQKLEDINGGSHSRKLLEIEEAQKRATDARATFDQHIDRLPELERLLRKERDDAEAIKVPLQTKRAEIQQGETLLQSLLRDRGQRYGAFHENTQLLLRSIENESGFKEKPIGPVGNYVRLLKPIWSNALERSFGGTLNSYIVTSKQDQTILSQLMRRVNCVCPILIGNKQPIDTSAHEPDPDFDTTLRVLEIQDQLVRSQLIINQGIEQTLLIEDREEAVRVMYDGSRPRNVKQCFCLQENRRGWGLRFAFGRSGEPNSSPIEPRPGKPRMKTDIESQINYQKETLTQLKRELNDLEARRRELEEGVRRRDQEIVRHKRRQRDLQLDVQRAEEHLESLQDELDKENVEDGRLEALKTNLQDEQDNKALLENSYEDAINTKDRLNQRSKQLQDQLDVMDEGIVNGEAVVRKAETKSQRLGDARQTNLEECNASFDRIEDAKSEKNRAESRLKGQADTVQHFISQASRVSDRVPIDAGETPDSIDKKLAKLSADLARFSKEMGGSREDIAERAATASEVYKRAEVQVDDLEELIQILKYALGDRQERWKKFRRFISSRARATFTYLLSERSFRGSLKTDHTNHVLDLHVEPDETKTGKGRQTKTLSGGEKSFSTICLLLSLWEAMGSPIRCLDEFDVFMDNVNRDVSMGMMIAAARRSVSRQFILITPQSMSNVNLAADVKIIKLNDPERGQTTLTFA
ncbi:DNA repair protein Rad18 [Xylona heveae TC161]|uniref:DNA repair protein Rad18 n=1 Tax=Xylona heveae (strain CBS 132557 / TC161) TaxID=1328760 RepID=A0A164ZAX0_XYLHT|nr:DNA repair protein Rad18 [Xylona heveae TC161]KZF18881.1 DNA repair protein Rad18 [Xylona heveae TC161]